MPYPRSQSAPSVLFVCGWGGSSVHRYHWKGFRPWQLGLVNSTWLEATCLAPHYSSFLLGNSMDEQDLPNWPWTSLPTTGLTLLQPPLLQQESPISKHNSAILHLMSKSSCSEQAPVGQMLFRVACPAFFSLPEHYIPRLVAGRSSGKVNCLELYILGQAAPVYFPSCPWNCELERAQF